MKSQEALMLRDVWRRAYEAADGLNIEFKSKAGATRARMQLYNVVKTVKSGKEMDDLMLYRAATELEIVWAGERTIRLQKRSESDMMQSIAAVLGKGAAEYVDPAVAASASKLLQDLERIGLGEHPPELTPHPLRRAEDQKPGEHQDNPFYGKRVE